MRKFYNSFSILDTVTSRCLEGHDLRVTHGLGRPFHVYSVQKKVSDITIMFKTLSFPLRVENALKPYEYDLKIPV